MLSTEDHQHKLGSLIVCSLLLLPDFLFFLRILMFLFFFLLLLFHF